MTATVRLAGENHQPFAALWRFEQGQEMIQDQEMLRQAGTEAGVRAADQKEK